MNEQFLRQVELTRRKYNRNAYQTAFVLCFVLWLQGVQPSFGLSVCAFVAQALWTWAVFGRALFWWDVERRL